MAGESGGESVLKFVGTLFQGGTETPTLVVLENTLGTTLTSSKEGTGRFLLTSDDPVFTEGKTFIMLNDTNAADDMKVVAMWWGVSAIKLKSMFQGDFADGQMASEVSIEIRVYP